MSRSISIVGNLVADPVITQRGTIEVIRLRVAESTYAYRQGERVDTGAIYHRVEAAFELADNIMTSGLKAGDPVIVIGAERANNWDRDGEMVYDRTVDALHVGPNLRNSTITDLTRTARGERTGTPAPTATPAEPERQRDAAGWGTPRVPGTPGEGARA